MSDRVSTDRNLLFGILALQMDFISRDGLIGAMNAWVLQKDKPSANYWSSVVNFQNPAVTYSKV